AVRRWARWNATRAAFVFGPKTPSTVSFAPRAFSRYCRERTVTFGQALFAPWRRTGHGWSAWADASRSAWPVTEVVAAEVAAGAAAAVDTGRAMPAARVPVASTTAPMVLLVVIVDSLLGDTAGRGLPCC